MKNGLFIPVITGLFNSVLTMVYDSARERVILFNSARRCEVYKLLTGELRFEYRLSGRQAGGDG